ncbi:MAG: hypothetical protein ACRCVU_04980 [Flavobacterium sp.]
MLDRTKIYDLSGITENQWQDLKWYLGRDNLSIGVKTKPLNFFHLNLKLGFSVNDGGKWVRIDDSQILEGQEVVPLPVERIPELHRKVLRLIQHGGDNVTRDCHLYYDLKAKAAGQVTEQELPFRVEVTFLEISNWGDEIFVTLIDKELKTYTISVEEYERLMAEQKSYTLTLYSPIEVIGKKRKFIKSL